MDSVQVVHPAEPVPTGNNRDIIGDDDEVDAALAAALDTVEVTEVLDFAAPLDDFAVPAATWAVVVVAVPFMGAWQALFFFDFLTCSFPSLLSTAFRIIAR